MRILFVWTGVTSYMADCWRELARLPGVELEAVIEDVTSGQAFEAGRVLEGIDHSLCRMSSVDVAVPKRPDIIFAVGWHSRTVRALVTREEWASVPKVCCFDMPWRWSPRCIAARWVLRPFLRRYDAAYVPGRTCAKYAKWLGFRDVRTGLFSIDADRFAAPPAPGRRGFLYVGRHSPEKRMDLIEKAYRRYRELGGSWSLDRYGQGGRFIQPDEMPRIYAEHACLLLASAFDPWPLVALEALTAGCEVVMSDRCGNRFELTDARVVRFGDVEAMAREMLLLEGRRKKEEGSGLAEDGAADEALAQYECEAWASRTLRLAEGLVKGGAKK